jgi:hypothetical protein
MSRVEQPVYSPCRIECTATGPIGILVRVQQPHTNGPDVSKYERSFLTGDLALVPRSCFRSRRFGVYERSFRDTSSDKQPHMRVIGRIANVTVRSARFEANCEFQVRSFFTVDSYSVCVFTRMSVR